MILCVCVCMCLYILIFWEYILRIPKHEFERIFASLCLLQSYLQSQDLETFCLLFLTISAEKAIPCEKYIFSTTSQDGFQNCSCSEGITKGNVIMIHGWPRANDTPKALSSNENRVMTL